MLVHAMEYEGTCGGNYDPGACEADDLGTGEGDDFGVCANSLHSRPGGCILPAVFCHDGQRHFGFGVGGVDANACFMRHVS